MNPFYNYWWFGGQLAIQTFRDSIGGDATSTISYSAYFIKKLVITGIRICIWERHYGWSIMIWGLINHRDLTVGALATGLPQLSIKEHSTTGWESSTAKLFTVSWVFVGVAQATLRVGPLLTRRCSTVVPTIMWVMVSGSIRRHEEPQGRIWKNGVMSARHRICGLASCDTTQHARPADSYLIIGDLLNSSSQAFPSYAA